jgi:flavodoxin
MQILVVYFSLNGNTRLMAEQIAAATGAERLELKPVNPVPDRGFRKYIQGGRQVLTGAEPELEPLGVDPAAYDVLFIGTPVWAGTLAPALRTFLRDVTLTGKTIALFCCHGGGGPARTFKRMRAALAGNRVVAETAFRDPRTHATANQTAEAERWARAVLEKGAPE